MSEPDKLWLMIEDDGAGWSVGSFSDCETPTCRALFVRATPELIALIEAADFAEFRDREYDAAPTPKRYTAMQQAREVVAERALALARSRKAGT